MTPVLENSTSLLYYPSTGHIVHNHTSKKKENTHAQGINFKTTTTTKYFLIC